MTSDRFSWAVDAMNIQPDDHILEIGCGGGLAVEKIATLLGTGKITAIDRSASACEKAIRRNAIAVKIKKASLIQTDLLKMPVPKKKFNKIFCFNINFFWTNESIHEEAVLIKRLLSPKGELHIFYGPLLNASADKIESRIPAKLREEGFAIIAKQHDAGIYCWRLCATK